MMTFVAVEAELFEAQGDLFGRLQQVGEEQDHAAAVHQADGVLQQPRQARAAGRARGRPAGGASGRTGTGAARAG